MFLGQTGCHADLCVFGHPKFAIATFIERINRFEQYGACTIEDLIQKQYQYLADAKISYGFMCEDIDSIIEYVELHTSLHRSNKVLLSNRYSIFVLIKALAEATTGVNITLTTFEDAYDLWTNNHINHPCRSIVKPTY